MGTFNSPFIGGPGGVKQLPSFFCLGIEPSGGDELPEQRELAPFVALRSWG